jgi:Zn-dependent membrane protease YugP
MLRLYHWAVFIFIAPHIALSCTHFLFNQSLLSLSEKPVASGITARQAASRIAKANDLPLTIRSATPSEGIGAFVLHENGQQELVFDSKLLSSASIPAVAVAAHEAGHAIQYKNRGFIDIATKYLAPSLVSYYSTAFWLLASSLTLPWNRRLSLFMLRIAIVGAACYTVGATLKTYSELHASAVGLTALRNEQIITEEEGPEVTTILILAGSTYASRLVVYAITFAGLKQLYRSL